MPEKPPKGPFKNSEPVYFDFEAKKRRPGPPEDQQAILPEMPEEEARKIDRDIFDNFERKTLFLCELVEKAREKFTAYQHLVSSGQYSEGHYRTYISQQRPHRLGSKLGAGKEGRISRIFNEDETRLYGKIWEYEKEFKKYIDNFLLERQALEGELDNTYSHLKNFTGAETLKERLEKYLKKIDFDFTSSIFIQSDMGSSEKKIEKMEEFIKKLVN